MRYASTEKLDIIQLIEQSLLSGTAYLGIPESTFYPDTAVISTVDLRHC